MKHTIKLICSAARRYACQQVQAAPEWFVVPVDSETLKQILSADDSAEQMKFASWNGKTILFPVRTSTMGKRRFSELLDWLIAEATTAGVYPVFVNGYRDAA